MIMADQQLKWDQNRNATSVTNRNKVKEDREKESQLQLDEAKRKLEEMRL